MESITKKEFELILNQTGLNPRLNRDFLFELTNYAIEGANELQDKKILGKMIPINLVDLILYLINEYGFYLDSNSLKSQEIENNDEAITKIVSIALDKYFTNEILNYKNELRVTKYSPLISTLNTYLNFLLGIMNRFAKKNPFETLVNDILSKAFSMIKAAVDLITQGFETEAFSLWRTIHESECILILLKEYGDHLIGAYLKHLNYAIAYRGGIPNKEETDRVFEQLKGDMKNLGLKSKDMKKFIEYGWLTSVPNYNADPMFKFNFRDGVERLANLSTYSTIYEKASEIAHSSPLLIYSRADYYLKMSIRTIYESFFRLEIIFKEMYVKNISNEEQISYIKMRTQYYGMLEKLYEMYK